MWGVEHFWKGLISWLKRMMLKEGMICREDLDLFKVIDDPDEVVKHIQKFDCLREDEIESRLLPVSAGDQCRTRGFFPGQLHAPARVGERCLSRAERQGLSEPLPRRLGRKGPKNRRPLCDRLTRGRRVRRQCLGGGYVGFISGQSWPCAGDTPPSPGRLLRPDSRGEGGDLVLVDAVGERINQDFRPQGFNIGINVGAAAGQTIFHVHMHVIPRYTGDVADPRGGVRWVIRARAPYWKDIE